MFAVTIMSDYAQRFSVFLCYQVVLMNFVDDLQLLMFTESASRAIRKRAEGIGAFTSDMLCNPRHAMLSLHTFCYHYQTAESVSRCFWNQ